MIALRYVHVPAGSTRGNQWPLEDGDFAHRNRRFHRPFLADRSADAFARTQATFHNQNLISFKKALDLRIDLRKDDSFNGTRHILDRRNQYLLAGLCERAPHAGHHARDANERIVFALAQIFDRHGTGASECFGHVRQRMSRDENSQRLLLPL